MGPHSPHVSGHAAADACCHQACQRNTFRSGHFSYDLVGMNAKQSKKDSAPPNAVAADELSMAALTSLLNCHKGELASEFKISFSALKAKIDLVQATVSSHCQRITSLETNADSVDGHLLSLEATCAELTAVSEKLKAKTADLEARRRCNNVRIIGLWVD